MNVQGEIQKDMDRIANDVFVRNLIPVVAVMASEEEENVLHGDHYYIDNNDTNNSSYYEIAFDPLDGSSNLDVNLPTGSIFGISEYDRCFNDEEEEPFTKPGSDLVVAGYALYSSS